MRKIQTLIIFLISIGISAQNITEFNSDLNLSDSLTYEREIRIYQDNEITNYSSLFRIFKDKSEKWIAEFYERYAKVNSQSELQTNKQTLESVNDIEYVYVSLLRSHILDLPSLKEIKWKLETRNEIKEVERYHKGKFKKELLATSNKKHIVDGKSYKVQAKGWKTNEFEFSNPYIYLKMYPDVDELIFICEIMDTIQKECGIWKK